MKPVENVRSLTYKIFPTIEQEAHMENALRGLPNQYHCMQDADSFLYLEYKQGVSLVRNDRGARAIYLSGIGIVRMDVDGDRRGITDAQIGLIRRVIIQRDYSGCGRQWYVILTSARRRKFNGCG